MWSFALIGSGGFAYFPEGCEYINYDGLFVDPSTFPEGMGNYPKTFPVNEGNTFIHELGHSLGLEHTF